MPSGYIRLDEKSPRSLLFYVVANVGPGGSSRPLAVAYRQGNDVSRSSSRVAGLVNDTLSVINILSDPAHYVTLKTERARAMDWYLQRQEENQDSRPSPLPDLQQPPFMAWNAKWKPILLPELPNNDIPVEFPETSELLVEGLLRGTESTRKGDVQMQPLTLPFGGNCLEYGMVVVDISDLGRVKYGIVAVPVCYMANVFYHSEYGGWDPVEDEQPKEEPDVVLMEERPRILLSILDYVRRYFPFLEDDPEVLELAAHSRVEDSKILDCGSREFSIGEICLPKRQIYGRLTTRC